MVPNYDVAGSNPVYGSSGAGVTPQMKSPFLYLKLTAGKDRRTGLDTQCDMGQ